MGKTTITVSKSEVPAISLYTKHVFNTTHLHTGSLEYCPRQDII